MNDENKNNDNIISDNYQTKEIKVEKIEEEKKYNGISKVDDNKSNDEKVEDKNIGKKTKGKKVASCCGCGCLIFLLLIIGIFVASCNAAIKIVKNFVASDVLSDDLVRNKQVTIKGDGNDTVTILVYMNGSNLESDGGEATTDLKEMVDAGTSDKVNILVQTMGTKSWEDDFDISSKHTQRYLVNGSGLTLVDDSLAQLDCTVSETLSDFITYGAKNYPADRYILLFWNHGGGPVYGFGLDEYQNEEDSLTIDEMQTALKKSGVYFDFIGMDCCIMSSLEVCCALYDFCDYMILSEDFESYLGWYYTNWLEKLYKNTSISTVELGKIICDDMVSKNENDSYGDDAILAVIDQSMMKVLYQTWIDFAYENESALTGTNYSRKIERSGRALNRVNNSRGFFTDWLFDDDDTQMSDYYITDIMAVCENIDGDKKDALKSALDNAIVYCASTSGDSGLTGLSVTLPYGDNEFYNELKTIFTNAGFDDEYVNWLSNFIGTYSYDDFYDYDTWDDDWSGWDDYDDDYDWHDWDYYYDDDSYYEDDSYWYDDYGWNDWDYDDSYNYWYDDYYYDDNYDDNYDYYDYYDDYGYDMPPHDDYYYDDYYDDYDDDSYGLVSDIVSAIWNFLF